MKILTITALTAGLLFGSTVNASFSIISSESTATVSSESTATVSSESTATVSDEYSENSSDLDEFEKKKFDEEILRCFDELEKTMSNEERLRMEYEFVQEQEKLKNESEKSRKLKELYSDLEGFVPLTTLPDRYVTPPPSVSCSKEEDSLNPNELF